MSRLACVMSIGYRDRMVHISVRNREAARPRLERVAKLIQAGLPQSEVGRALGVSRERVRQLVVRARDLGLLPKVGVAKSRG